MPRLALHLGAHKTATTYIQRSFATNLETLKAKGIYFLPLDILRKNFTSLLTGTEETDITRELLAACRRQDVVISDENIAGSPGDVIKHGTYYPNVGKRLAKVMAKTGNSTPEIFFGFRDYASFVISSYCEFLRHREYVPFAPYGEAFAKSGFSWLQVVDQIVREAPKADVTVWDFALVKTDVNRILSAIAGFDASSLEKPTEPLRSSFSAQTVTALDHLAKIMSPDMVGRAVGPMSRAFPKGADFPAFNPFDKATTDRLTERYQADLDTIRRKHPRIRFL